MPFTPSAHPLQNSFAPYASLSKPSVGTAFYDQVYNDDLLSIKVQLRSMLDMNRLSNKPVSFPFSLVCDGHGRPVISYESYEFQEQFCFSDQLSRTQTATFSYTAPSFNFKERKQQRMTWRITVPSRESSSNGNISCTKLSIAQVEVDPIVMETSFGVIFMTDPRILLQALSRSVALGVLITVTVANCKTPIFYPTNQNLDYVPGDIIFIVTDNNRNSEVVLVFKV